MLLGALTLVCAIGLTAASAWLIARASQMPPILTLSVAVVGVRAFGVGRAVARYAERLATHDAALRGIANLRANLYDRLATQPLHRHSQAELFTLRRGELLDRVGADVDEVGNLIVRSIVPTGVALLVGLASVVFLWTMLPMAGLALLSGLLLAGGLAPWLTYRATIRSEQQLAAARAGISAESLRLIEDGQQLRVSGNLSVGLDKLASAESQLAQAQAASSRRLGFANSLSGLAQALTVIASLAIGAQALVPGGRLTMLAPYAADFGGGLPGRVWLAVIVITPMAVFEATGALPAAAVQLARSQAAAQRLLTLISSPTEPTTPEQIQSNPPAAPNAHRIIGAPPSRVPDTAIELAAKQKPAIQLNHVDIGWPDTGIPLWQNLSISLNPGDTLAIVGPSGSGKTTLLVTIAGLLPPLRGEVHTAGTALFIAEDDHIFATTILENLRVARGSVTDDEAAAALAAVGLSDWLSTLPAGLNTLLSSDATTVSGGERRRLLAARAILSPAQILLFDEPAEHLDPTTSDLVIKALVNHAKSTGRVLVIATHRPAEAELCDNVLAVSTVERMT